MAFITKSNAKSILREISLSKFGNFPVEGVYPGDLSILSDNERRWLAASRMFYEDFESFIKYAYQKRSKPVDTYKFVYEGRSPSYHDDRECGCLLSDYFNFEVPVEIQYRGEGDVTKFRAWFRANEHLIRSGEHKRFITKMEIQFRLKNPPKADSLEAPNSGIEFIDNRPLTNLREDIDKLIDDARRLRSGDDDKAAIIRRFGHRCHETFDDEVIHQAMDEWRELKKKIKFNLLEYFKVSLNPELDFNGPLLEQLGFSRCRACHGEQVATSSFHLPDDWSDRRATGLHMGRE